MDLEDERDCRNSAVYGSAAQLMLQAQPSCPMIGRSILPFAPARERLTRSMPISWTEAQAVELVGTRRVIGQVAGSRPLRSHRAEFFEDHADARSFSSHRRVEFQPLAVADGAPRGIGERAADDARADAASAGAWATFICRSSRTMPVILGVLRSRSFSSPSIRSRANLWPAGEYSAVVSSISSLVQPLPTPNRSDPVESWSSDETTWRWNEGIALLSRAMPVQILAGSSPWPRC